MAEGKSWWMCNKCRYITYQEDVPEACPVCGQKCGFIDATCYTPECGGPGNPDPQIVCQVGLRPTAFHVNT